MQFSLNRLNVLTVLIFAGCNSVSCNSAWAQSRTAKFADLTIGDFNATISKREFQTVENKPPQLPSKYLKKPIPSGHLGLSFEEREFQTRDKKTPVLPYLKEPASSRHPDLNLEETAQKIRLNLTPGTMNSEEPILSSPLFKNTTRTVILSPMNQSQRNNQEDIFPKKPKIKLKLDLKCNYI